MSKGFPEVGKEGMQFITSHEGRIPYVYDDAVYPTRMYKRGEKVKGTLTAGVGHTGPDVNHYIGSSIPDAVIDQWLDDDLDVAERAVHRLVKAPITKPQRIVLVSFTFNVGVGAFENSTLLRKLNNLDYGAVPAQLARWNKTTISGKKIESAGLTKRRASEAALWATGVAPQIETGPAGSSTAEPDAQSIVTKESITWAVGILSTLSTIFVGEGPVQWAIAAVIPVAFGLGVFAYLKKRVNPA